MSPYESINDIFRAASAKNGNVVRRKIANVEKHASLKYLLKEVQELRRPDLRQLGRAQRPVRADLVSPAAVRRRCASDGGFIHFKQR